MPPHDTDQAQFTIYRRPYNVTSTQSKVREAGLDEKLAVRLELGK